MRLPSGETCPWRSSSSGGVGEERPGRRPLPTTTRIKPPAPRSRCENTMRPSRVQDGQRSSPSSVVSLPRVAAVRRTTTRSKPSPLSAAKTIDLPSGDHAGSRSIVGAVRPQRLGRSGRPAPRSRCDRGRKRRAAGRQATRPARARRAVWLSARQAELPAPATSVTTARRAERRPRALRGSCGLLSDGVHDVPGTRCRSDRAARRAARCAAARGPQAGGRRMPAGATASATASPSPPAR